MSGGSALPPFPEPMTLAALQDYVARMVAARGFTQDVDRVFVLWVEELGELAEHLGPAAGEGYAEGSADRAALGAELADVTLYLADLANGLGLHLEGALDGALPASVGRLPAGAPLSQWQALAAGVPEAAAAPAELLAGHGLLAAAGQVARVLRKRWSGLAAPEAARPLGDALGQVLRLANRAGVDLARAIAEKERENAGRTWSY